MNKKRYLLPETIVHEIEIQSVLQTESIGREDEPSDELTDNVNESRKSKDFNAKRLLIESFQHHYLIQ